MWVEVTAGFQSEDWDVGGEGVLMENIRAGVLGWEGVPCMCERASWGFRKIPLALWHPKP